MITCYTHFSFKGRFVNCRGSGFVCRCSNCGRMKEPYLSESLVCDWVIKLVLWNFKTTENSVQTRVLFLHFRKETAVSTREPFVLLKIFMVRKGWILLRLVTFFLVWTVYRKIPKPKSDLRWPNKQSLTISKLRCNLQSARWHYLTCTHRGPSIFC